MVRLSHISVLCVLFYGSLLYLGLESGLMFLMLGPLRVDLVHLGLYTLEHAITVVAPGAKHVHDGANITLPD